MSTVAPLLLVRADASTAMGVGHVLRTLAVAQAWRLSGGRVRYAACTLPEGLVIRLDAEGCDLEHWDDMEPGTPDDGRRVRDASDGCGAAAVLVDGYQFAEPFRREASQARARSLLVHDFAVDGPLWLDFVLNQNPQARPTLYPRVDWSRQLLGLRWCMVRREFTEAVRPPIRDDIPPFRVLVTLGAGDPHDVTGRVLRALDDVARPLEIRVVAGAANPHLGTLRETANLSPHPAEILVEVADMRALMAWADVAVAAAGSTSWELAYMGVPWLSIAIADNQRPIMDAVTERGLAVALGWWEDVNEARIAGKVLALLDDPPSRRRMREQATRIVDGAGAARVAGLLRGHA